MRNNMIKLWQGYDASMTYDELLDATKTPRSVAKKLYHYINSLTEEDVKARKQSAEATIKQMGISFTVYSQGQNIDRAWPFDIIPRTISRSTWDKVASGLKQRLRAINLFIDDLYHDQKIIKDGIIPAELIQKSKNFRKECIGFSPPLNIWAHICGTDLVRDKDGEFYVLEDNLRVPSGVSYMLENRSITKRIFPELFVSMKIAPVNNYTSELFDMLSSLSPRKRSNPIIVVLTPGIFNSAYFEHAYLAQQMGAELVEGSDLTVEKDDCVYMKTIAGLERVDVIYRRIDDLYLDPECFEKDSVLGCAGVIRAWKKGNVAIANAPGAGVADDKVIYAFMPKIIKYYLDQDPIINNVKTWLCLDKKQRQHVINNIEDLVVKPANESGGYGILIGPHSTKKERETVIAQIKNNPRNFIAQPTISISTAPCLVDKGSIEPRHLDLRPFVLQGKKIFVTTGGLTRVAMKKGSLVVNSSQGGGSKDTWIVDKEDK
jgi:uncharacterized circularly permuted ATP-grasp superfamily protein